MKIKSLKEVDNYIYSTLIMPFKGLSLDWYVESPMRNDMGRPIEFSHNLTPIGSYRCNYQTNRALANRDYDITVHSEGVGSDVIGKYTVKGRFIELYRDMFEKYNIRPMLGRMSYMFDSNTPFTKVTIKESRPEVRLPQRNRQPVELVWTEPDWESDEEGYGEDL